MTTREELIGLLKSHAKVWVYLEEAYRHDSRMVPYAEGDADEAERAVLAVFDAQASRVAVLEAMLHKLEWAGGAHATEDMCPVCMGAPEEGHEDGCALAALLESNGSAREDWNAASRAAREVLDDQD